MSIRSIGHAPVLFEDVGARPYPPREVYKPRLEAAHIFVAIYRESYGWVAPDMTISGVEDEFQIAADRGIDRLFYVLRPAPNRDSRLESLISEASRFTTLRFYANADELHDQIRDDITAIVSERFARQTPDSLEAFEPKDILTSLLPDPHHRIRRNTVETRLIAALDESYRALVFGHFGSGKTIFLAQLALDREWVFVDARGLTGLETLARCANELRFRKGRPHGTYPTEEAARSALLEAWSATDKVTLVVDGAADGRTIWESLDAAHLSQDRRLVVTSRRDFAVPSELRFSLPPWAEDEVAELAYRIRGTRPQGPELDDLIARSERSPLYVRFFAQAEPDRFASSLKELEIRAIDALEPTAREVAAYLALCGHPLSLLDLQQLVGETDGGVDALASLVGRSSLLLRQVRGVVDLAHEHLRDTLLEQLQASTATLAYLGTRLTEFLSARGDDLTAFHVVMSTGDKRPPLRLVDRAVFQVSLRGGGRDALPVIEERLSQARTWADRQREITSLLAMAQVVDQIGEPSRARDLMADARRAAAAHDDAELQRRVEEMALELQLRRGPSSAALNDLSKLKEQYQEEGRRFDSARIALSLSAEYIDRNQPELAVPLAREALAGFSDYGDEYGIRLAKLNLAAALISLRSSDEEGLQLTQDLSESVDPESLPRERAVICNLLTRRYRALDQPQQAEAYAREAIQIGESLGDPRVISINTMNLGNTLRDQERLEAALEKYRLADRIANAAGLRRIEAAANELISSVLNEQEDYRLSLQHSQHAAALARVSEDFDTAARAYEEQATAFTGLGEIGNAVDAYAEATESIRRSGSKDRRFLEYLSRGLALAAQQGKPTMTVKTMTRVFGQVKGEPLQVLCDVMPAVASDLPAADLVPVSALVFSRVLDDVPAEIERQVIVRVLDRLTDDSNVAPKAIAASVAGVLLASDRRRLPLSDLVETAERLARILPGVHFKPGLDGSAHWTVALPLGQGVICSIAQLDEQPWVASTTLVLVLLLYVLAEKLRDEVVTVDQLPRSELIVHTVSFDDFTTHVPAELSGLGDMEEAFRIAGPVDVVKMRDVPLVAICKEGISSRWLPTSQGLTEIHFMFASLVKQMTSSLFAQEVESEILHPKLASIVKRISSPIA